MVRPRYPLCVFPVRMPRLQVGQINGKTYGVGFGYKQRTTGHRIHVHTVFAHTHIVVTTHNRFIRREINIIPDIKIHAASHILHHQTITARSHGRSKINVPHIRSRQVTAQRLGTGTVAFPESNFTRLVSFTRFHVIHHTRLPSKRL